MFIIKIQIKKDKRLIFIITTNIHKYKVMALLMIKGGAILKKKDICRNFSKFKVITMKDRQQ